MLRTALLGSIAACVLGAAPAAGVTRAPCTAVPGAPSCLVWSARVTFVADGDTIRADVAGDGTSRSKTIRLTGINAMELRRYSKYPERRRGDCHGVAAADFVDRAIRRSHRRVRLYAQDAGSRSGKRLYRSVWVRGTEGWRDLGGMEMRAGLALWLPNHVETAHNREYRLDAERAAAAHRALYDPTACGPGPDDDARLRLDVRWDADGNDEDNVNGEWATIANRGLRPVSIAGWWFRDSALRRFTFPSTTVVAPGDRVRLHMGCGTSTLRELYWCQPAAVFENGGDGGYLFDPQGDLRLSYIYP